MRDTVMKNENIILIRFLIIMAGAVAAGAVRGRLALPLAAGGIFLPQLLILGPVLVALSAFLLAVAWRAPGRFNLHQICVLCFTGMGVVLSGCCGFYTLAHIAMVVCTVAVAVVVLLAALYLQSADTGRIHSRKIYHTDKEKLTAALFFAVTGLSLFAPLGPVPVLAAGMRWRVVIKKV